MPNWFCDVHKWITCTMFFIISQIQIGIFLEDSFIDFQVPINNCLNSFHLSLSPKWKCKLPIKILFHCIILMGSYFHTIFLLLNVDEFTYFFISSIPGTQKNTKEHKNSQIRITENYWTLLARWKKEQKRAISITENY